MVKTNLIFIFCLLGRGRGREITGRFKRHVACLTHGGHLLDLLSREGGGRWGALSISDVISFAGQCRTLMSITVECKECSQP